MIGSGLRGRLHLEGLTKITLPGKSSSGDKSLTSSLKCQALVIKWQKDGNKEIFNACPVLLVVPI